MWMSRSGKVGEKITPIQFAASSLPPGRTTEPAGACIQLLAEMIQNEETRVPNATRQVAAKCRPGPTFFQPISMTPRKLDSRKKAVATSKANSGPITGAAALEKTLQLVPNS